MSDFDNIEVSPLSGGSTHNETEQQYTDESEYVSDGTRTFLNRLNTWAQSIRHLAPDDEEEPLTPVSGGFDSVVQAYECYILMIDGREPDNHRILCADPSCTSMKDALSMALYAVRDILRQNRKIRAWYWNLQSNQDIQNLTMGDADKTMEAATISLASSVLHDMRQSYDKFSQEMQLREEDRTNWRGGIHNSRITTVTWDAIGQVSTNLRRRSSDKGLSWRDKILVENMSFYGNQIDRGTQWDDDLEQENGTIVRDERDLVSTHKHTTTVAKELIVMVQERLRGPDKGNNAGAEGGAGLSIDVTDKKALEGPMQNLENEGVVFNMPEIIPAREGLPPFPKETDTMAGYTATGYSFSTSEEAGYDDKNHTDYNAIGKWAENIASISDLEASNNTLREAVQRLQNEKGDLQKRLNAATKDLNDRQGFIESLVMNRQLSTQNQPDKDINWAFDPLLSYFAEHVKAWTNILAYISFKTLRIIGPLFNRLAGSAQQWSSRLMDHHLSPLDAMKFSQTKPVKAPSPHDVAYLVKQLVVLFTLRKYILLQKERSIWFHANGLTRRYMLGYASLRPSWWEGTVTRGGQTCGGATDSEALMIFFAQFSEIWIEYLIRWFMVALNIIRVLQVWRQVARKYWDMMMGLGHLIYFLLWVFSGHWRRNAC